MDVVPWITPPLDASVILEGLRAEPFGDERVDLFLEFPDGTYESAFCLGVTETKKLLHAQTSHRGFQLPESSQSSTAPTVEFHAKRKGQPPIKTFNTDWVDGARTLKANGMELPDTYLVNLYLSSLGDQYATIGTVVHAMPATERTLAKIMKMAEDHTIADTDEPDISVAMLTQLEEQGFVVTKRQAETSEFVTKRHKSNRGYAQVANSNTPDTHASECELCGMKYHTQSTCFAHGGGLSHLAAHERRAWIHAKRKAKNEGRPMPTTWPLPQQTNTGRAAAAHTTTQDLTERLAVRDAQIQKIQSIYMSSPAHIDEFNTGILEASWKPF